MRWDVLRTGKQESGAMLQSFQILAWMIINSNRKNSNLLESCQKFAHTMSWNACIWHELYDLTSLWSVNKLASSVTKLTLSHKIDSSMWRWFPFCTTRMTIVNIVTWETRHSIADWVSSKTQAVLATLRTQNQPQEVSCVFLEVEHFVPVSWMCKKQTWVSQSSTESEVISLYAGLRMDGLPALDLWEMVIEVLHSSNNRKSSTQGAAGPCLQNSNTKLKKKDNRNVDQVSDLDHVVTYASSSQWKTKLNPNIPATRKRE